jgi:hypothetical protein
MDNWGVVSWAGSWKPFANPMETSCEVSANGFLAHRQPESLNYLCQPSHRNRLVLQANFAIVIAFNKEQMPLKMNQLSIVHCQ